MLHALLRNLVDNATRYSPAGSRVQVVTSSAGEPTVTVTEEGPGIPPGERAEVLKRFRRRLGTGRCGTGLGLSILQRIAELHRAELRSSNLRSATAACALSSASTQ
ncbi:MAG: ATP-binding protein [Sulfurifustaceae bacterium]